jgi:hypothetical protein
MTIAIVGMPITRDGGEQTTSPPRTAKCTKKPTPTETVTQTVTQTATETVTLTNTETATQVVTKTLVKTPAAKVKTTTTTELQQLPITGGDPEIFAGAGGATLVLGILLVLAARYWRRRREAAIPAAN